MFSDGDSADAVNEEGRRVQVVLDGSDQTASHRFQIYSRGAGGEWTQHAEGYVPSGAPLPEAAERTDLDGLRSRLSPADVPAYYRAKSTTGIDLGPSFQTLGMVWAGPGEALGEVRLPEALVRNQLDLHPLLLDGCFQVVGLARNMTGEPGEATYLPFGWQSLWLAGRLPDRFFCHVTMREASPAADSVSGEPPETLSGELRIYDPTGLPLGSISGYTVKRATPSALLSAIEGIDDLLYEVIWRDNPLQTGIEAADFFPAPADILAGSPLFTSYLSDAGVAPQGRNALLADLERWSWVRALTALEELGWRRAVGDVVDAEGLRERLNVLPEHSRLFRRMLEMAARAGALQEREGSFVVTVGEGEELPGDLPRDLAEFGARMQELYPHGLVEIGLFQRSGQALADVLGGQADPLTLLFSSGEPTAADLYLKAPVARAANRMIADSVQALVAALPEGRRLRVIEVGAGTGSATASVLPELPEGRFDYLYTDISAGFFAEAEARFGDGGGGMEYRQLDIEKDPIAQGFESHGYDLLIASNVLHATRRLDETLEHCRALLAPSGHLVALENLRGLGWMDLTFGQLDGWWRFADECRPHHALAGPAVWKQALADAGFEGSAVLGVDDSCPEEMLDKGVIVAQGPAQVNEPLGQWIVAGDGPLAHELAAELAAHNQAVVVATGDSSRQGLSPAADPMITETLVERGSREAWQAVIEGLPRDVPFSGLVHLMALDGHGTQATTPEIAEDVSHAGASALAMVQALNEADAIPQKGLWFITRGAQVTEREQGGELAGAVLWGLGKVVDLEAGHLQPRMIDLAPGGAPPVSDLVTELLRPDQENHIAYRAGRRLSSRLVTFGSSAQRLALPEGPDWVLTPSRAGVFDQPEVLPLPAGSLEPREVRVSVEAAGLNFWDVFRSLGFIEEGNLGRELCGYVVNVGSEVSTVSIGDRVVGLGFGAFGPEMVTREELVAPAPAGASASALAALPSAFVSSALSYRYSGLRAGDRVLIHAGAGGVGLAAIQLAQAAGAEVFATASAPKQAYLRSLGVTHIFDSRQTKFGKEILEATAGQGVDVVLNSLTSEGFIEASLACLAQGGRFVELARRDILSHEEMAAVRPDVAYSILELDVLKKTEPAGVGEVLREVMEQLSAGEIKPLVHSRWPLTEAGAALDFMRSARHVGKIVLTPPPLMKGQLRSDRTYLVTGGLGGIGIAVAGWLADHGAGAIVLNGRRGPSAEAEEAIAALRQRGIMVEVRLADVTDTNAIDAMLERMDAELPPLGGIIHSVGVLSDASLDNQSWASFEQVLWPKIKGAWHLHRATMDRDLDMFILFSSRVGVMGNPGQANHAAANAFLDQLASHRRALGLPGQAIAWGAWSEIGEAAEQRERIERRRAALGGRWFTPQQGIKALDRLVRQDTATSVVMSMDWSAFGEAIQSRPPLLEDLLSPVVDSAAAESAPSGDVLSQLRSVPAAERQQVLVSFLQREVQAVLRMPATPSPTVGFFDLGMDSLMSVELRNRLNRALSGAYVVSNTAVFDYPNVDALAGHLASELGGEAGGVSGADRPQPAAVAEASAPASRAGEKKDVDAVAIVGMACRFPSAPDLDSFWRLLENGSHAITDRRRDGDLLAGAVGDPALEDVIYRRGGFVDGIDQFDNRFFRIAPLEARLMDPQQRMLLETTWQALEDAGIDPDRIRGSRTGVYAGIGSSEYRDVLAANGQQDFYFGTSGSMTAGRIAFVLGLEGPAMPVDMACASSLAAIHQAANALRLGEVDLALACGVNATLSRSIMRFHRDMGMLSGIGQCNAFDAAADGFVRSEGCGVLVLKRLDRAVADGDRIWGLVRGSAVNQNGTSAGLPVPNGPAQERLIEDALARASVQPWEVDYVEAHGAGTELGDSIELRALSSVYGRGRDVEKPLLLGSVKTNIGHTEWASGMASVIKAVMAMRRGVIPAHLHFRQPNPNLDWDRIPVRVTSEKMPWPTTGERPPLAAVNSFGLSGSNAHVVLEGYAEPAECDGSDGYWPAGSPTPVAATLKDVDAAELPAEVFSRRAFRLLPLSGKSPNALRDLAGHYLSWLDVHAEGLGPDAASPLLADMAWTAGMGRSHFDYRSGLVFRDSEDLRAGLEGLLETSGAEVRLASPPTARTAFVFTGQGGEWPGMGESLYQTEPVVRSVLDRCNRLLLGERGASLLDVMFGRSREAGDLSDPLWAYPATYALEAALTALWTSVGIRPTRVLGQGVGEIAAARAAGILSFDDGLRLAAAVTSPDAALPLLPVTPPSLTMVSSLTGQAIQSPEELHNGHWRRLAGESAAWEAGVDALASAGADLIVEIGPHASPGLVAAPCWPPAREDAQLPTFVDGLLPPRGSAPEAEERFLRAVGAAYEAGARLSFDGLYAGEERRRIAIPGYPFQRRRFWVQTRSAAE
ncbi:MAG: SDR family NAD(P)-dependent oxidoreductase [Chloroflexota bacterium]|nr:SDR family NAD(P)-dependent oxidoreductase [Chloroflexota bacterium]